MSDNTPQIPKILVVEDAEPIQLVLQKFLSKKFDVFVCADGLEAMAYLQNGNMVQLIISDLTTPNMGGLELLQQVKASSFFKSIPVIVLSGDTESSTRIQCLEAGAEDYIVKPFNPLELEARIKVVLKRSGITVS